MKIKINGSGKLIQNINNLPDEIIKIWQFPVCSMPNNYFS